MSRSHKHKKIVKQKGKIFLELIEGEDYTILFILLVMVIMGLFVLFSPKYIFIGLSSIFFFFTGWQLYSGVALTMLSWDRRWVAKYRQDREPSLFYLNIAICFGLGIFILLFLKL